MSTKWKIYCTEPGDTGWKFAWSDVAISTCPNEAGHSVNSNSVNAAAREVEQFRIEPTFARVIKSNKLVRTCTFEYDPLNSGPIHRLRVVGNIGAAGSYDVELYDVTNMARLSLDTFTNENPDEIQVTSVVNSPPSSKALLEVNARKVTGAGQAEVSLFQVAVYGEK